MARTAGDRVPKRLTREAARPGPLRNPSTGGVSWYHGTRTSAAELASGLRFTQHDPAAEAGGHWAAHWNALLGMHFAAHHSSADRFARPNSGVGGASGGTGPRSTPSVIHARLHLANPRVYASEHDMADDAFEHEYDTRKNYISHHEDPSYPAETWFGYDDHPDERPAKGEWEEFRDWHDMGEEGDRPPPVYRRTQWLNLHPDKGGIVQRFRERLQAQGHDGIVYGNEEPGERVRSSRPESNMAAIAFHPGQVEVVKHHALGDEQRTAAVRYDEDGDEVGSDPEEYAHEETAPGRHRFSALGRWGNELGYADVHEKPDHVWLHNLYVHPDDRGRGIAGQLVDNMIAHFPGREIRLYPHPSPEGWERDDELGPDTDVLRDFYARHGFEDYRPREGDKASSYEHMVRHAARWQPSSGIFAPTTGLDGRLFDEQGRLRPVVRDAIMARLDRALRADARLVDDAWQEYLRVYLAGGSASEWAGARPNEDAQDLDVLIGVDYESVRSHSPALASMDDAQADAALNAALRSGFNESGWTPGFGGTWNLTGYVNHAAFDVRAIRPYAAYDVSGMSWAVRPPHLPGHTLADFDPAVLAHARAVTAQARAILRMPEPLRSREARDLWQHMHAHRCAAFSAEGQGWQDPGNLDEKWLAYAPGNVLGRIRELALAGSDTKTAFLANVEGMGDGGFTFEHRPGNHFEPHEVSARHPGSPGDSILEPGEAGRIQWRPDTGEVVNVRVHDSFRRQGLGTELWNRARVIDPGIRHSGTLSDDARQWIPRLGAHVPEDEPMIGTRQDLHWTADEWAEARREPWHVASRLAQEEVRRNHPLLLRPFPNGAEGDEAAGHVFRNLGFPEGIAAAAYVARHPDPSRMQSNPSWIDGFRGVALHPDKWDYGTYTHEAAHHKYLYDNGFGRNQVHDDERLHGPEWGQAYARGLNMLSRHAGDDFLHHQRRFRDMIGDDPQREESAELPTKTAMSLEPAADAPTQVVAASGYAGITKRSGMIYLDLPEDAVRHHPGGVDDHHITVVYLGKDVSDEAFAEACRRAKEAAAQVAPLSGFLRGVEAFEPGDGSDEKVPAFVPAYIPGIGRLRALLEDLNGSQHRLYRPHVTLAYLEPGEDLPAPHPRVDVSFSRLHVKRGDEIVSYPLGTGIRREAAVSPALYHGSGKRYRDGDLIDPAQPHKKVHPQSDPGKAYFSDSLWNARNWANVASSSGKGHVYEVEPTGEYEEDPHFSGPEERGIYDLSADPIRRVNAYQTGHPLRVIRRVPPGD